MLQANVSETYRDTFNYFENENKLEIEEINKYLKQLDLTNLSVSGLDNGND